jgi:hypothetical protein
MQVPDEGTGTGLSRSIFADNNSNKLNRDLWICVTKSSGIELQAWLDLGAQVLLSGTCLYLLALFSLWWRPLQSVSLSGPYRPARIPKVFRELLYLHSRTSQSLDKADLGQAPPSQSILGTSIVLLPLQCWL